MKEAFRSTVHQREEQKETEYMTKWNTSDYILYTSKATFICMYQRP